MTTDNSEIKKNEMKLIKRQIDLNRGLIEDWQKLKILKATKDDDLLKGLELLGYYKKMNHLGK